MLRVLQSTDPAVAAIIERRVTRDPAVQRAVRRIVNAVREEGDAAVERHARQFDGLTGSIEVSRQELQVAAASVPADVRAAVRACARNIRTVARGQVPRSWRARVADGVIVEHRVVPLDRVGCYVPAGRHPLPSSLLMTAIPARVAGVREVIAVCPKPDAVVMAAALEAGVTRLFRIGGAQAIAALAYGTATVPRVDRIVGPGNRYVAAAKSLVAADCAIDFEAGPTELVWLSDNVRPEWIARDLVAQAEHDPDARAFFVTTRRALAEAVRDEIGALAPLSATARQALASNGAAIVAANRQQAVALVDRIAPEHLVVDALAAGDRVPVAGTVFVGAWSAPAAGDYATGSNHVLPTAGAARFRGGLTAADFVRVVAVQRLSRAGIRRIGRAAATLAAVEGLTAHEASIEARLEAR